MVNLMFCRIPKTEVARPPCGLVLFNACGHQSRSFLITSPSCSSCRFMTVSFQTGLLSIIYHDIIARQCTTFVAHRTIIFSSKRVLLCNELLHSPQSACVVSRNDLYNVVVSHLFIAAPHVLLTFVTIYVRQ